MSDLGARIGCLVFILYSGWGGYLLCLAFGWFGFVAPWRFGEMPTLQVVFTVLGVLYTVAALALLRKPRPPAS